MMETGPLTRHEDRRMRVIAHIHAHPGEDLSLDSLAEVAALRRFHVHRVFRALTGETVAGMVRRILRQPARAGRPAA